MQDAGIWIQQAEPQPTYAVLIDEQHLVSKLYNMVNVPTGVWIDEQGRIVRPNEAAYVDNRYTHIHRLEAAPYLAALRDWVEKGDRSSYVFSEERTRKTMAMPNPDWALAAAEFGLAEHLHKAGYLAESIAHFKEAQRLNPESWNYKRQAYLLSDAKRDYGTSFGKEVAKLAGKPYYAPRDLPGEAFTGD